MTHAAALDQEYLSLEPLATRILTHEKYSEVVDDVEAAVRTAAGVTGGERLLDIGCGTGSFLRNLAGRGHAGRLVGVDLSPAAVAELAAVDGVDAQLADAQRLPFADASFDVVTARHMLYHVPDVDAALREARRVLAPGGVFAATVNHPHATPHVYELVAEAVAELGIEPRLRPNARLNSENLPPTIRAVFGDVRIDRHDNAFVFDRPEPLIAYAVAILATFDIGPDSPRRPDVVRRIVAKATQWFAEPGRVWRDPKGYVVCTARLG